MRMMLLAALSLLTSANPHAAKAQGGSLAGQDVRDTVYALATVDVVGTRTHYLTPAQKMEGKTLADLSTTSVADALKYFSGVQIKDYGGLGGLKTVNVRSLGSQHVGVYLDGIRITNAQNGQTDLGRYSLSNMESVALYNANRSQRLQSPSEYASAATVYMQTRRPTRSQTRLECGAGSFGMRKAKAYVSFKDMMFVDAEYQHARGDYKFRFRSASEDTTGTRHNSDISFLRTELATFHKSLRTHVYFYCSERGLPGPVVRRLSDQWDSSDRQWDRNFFAQSSWQHQWRSVAVKANVKYSYDWTRYRQDPSANAAAMACDNRYEQHDIYGSLSASWHSPLMSLTAATDFRWSSLHTNVAHSGNALRGDHKSLLSAIVSWRGLEANVALLYTLINDRGDTPHATLHRLTPMYMASWKKGSWVLRAFHKRMFRAPTFNELYYTLTGYASLKPEYTSQWDIGADYKSGRLHLAADFYYNDIKDKIVAMPVKSQFRWSTVNFGRVESLGMSLSGGYTYTGRTLAADIRFNYTCQRDLDRTSRSQPEYGNYIPYSPLHSASLISDIRYKGYSLCASLLYTGERFSLLSNNADDLLGRWYTVDVKLSKTFNAHGHDLQLTIECNNITNASCEVVRRYPMPGRNYKLSLCLSM